MTSSNAVYYVYKYKYSNQAAVGKDFSDPYR